MGFWKTAPSDLPPEPRLLTDTEIAAMKAESDRQWALNEARERAIVELMGLIEAHITKATADGQNDSLRIPHAFAALARAIELLAARVPR